MLRVLCLILISLLTVSCATAVEFTVGVSPAIIDLGEINPGTSRIVKFYLVTPSDEPLLVTLQPDDPGISFFLRDQYKSLITECSEQDVTGWLEFIKNPVEITIESESLKTVAGEIRGWREVSFLLNVPENAEPGYHAVRVKPVPYIPSELLGPVGAQVVAITAVSLLFKVPGNAVRDGLILDVTAGNMVGNRQELNTYFKNTGTVTIVVKGNQVILDGDAPVESLILPTKAVAPGETAVLKTYINRLQTEKQYTVKTFIDYTTGYVEKNSTIFVPSIQVQPEERVEEFPWLIVFLIVLIVLISIAIYKWYK